MRFARLATQESERSVREGGKGKGAESVCTSTSVEVRLCWYIHSSLISGLQLVRCRSDGVWILWK